MQPIFVFLLYVLNSCPQAGPGTIAEAMIRGLPIILNGYIAGQVSYDFLKKNLFLVCVEAY